MIARKMPAQYVEYYRIDGKNVPVAVKTDYRRYVRGFPRSINRKYGVAIAKVKALYND